MFSRPHRLASERDIRHLLRAGRTFRGTTLSIRFARGATPLARFTVVVSTRVSKRATVRNRVKRQIRELLRARLPRFREATEYLVNVFPKPSYTRDRFRDDIDHFLSLRRN